jgi:hypothetical protein
MDAFKLLCSPDPVLRLLRITDAALESAIQRLDREARARKSPKRSALPVILRQFFRTSKASTLGT